MIFDEMNSAPSLRAALAAAVVEMVLVGLLWFSMDALAHLRLTPAGFGAVVGSYVACMIAEFGLRRRAFAGRKVAILALTLLPAGIVLAFNASLHRPLGLGFILYATVFVGVVRAFWRRWTRGDFGEGVRRLVCFAGAGWGVYPLFSDLLMGGTDARWYSYMMNDFLTQERAGVFPIFLSQTEYAIDGAVHPFRSAPLYMWIGGVWDYLTLHALPMLSIQHMTVLTSLSAGAIFLYSGLCYIAPRQRWIAMGAALIYVLSPGVLSPLYGADMYMTMIAAGTVPLVMIGNMRVLLQPSAAAYRTLGAGLALTWMAHPPTGMMATLVTLALQVGGWAYTNVEFKTIVGRGFWIAIWFGGLALYYFTTMTELPPAPRGPMLPEFAMIAGLALGWLAGVRGLIERRWAWLLVLPLAVLLIALTKKIWLAWLLGYLAVCALLSLVPMRAREKLPFLGSIGATAAALAGAAFAWYIAQKTNAPFEPGSIRGLLKYSKEFKENFLPLTPKVNHLSDYQPGYGVFAFLLLSLIAIGKPGRLARIFGCVAFVLVVLLLRIPWASDFLDGYAPIEIGRIISLPLAPRIFPTACCCAVVGGFVGFAALAQRQRWLALVIVLGLSAWSAAEARKYVRYGFDHTASRARTARNYLPEDIVADRFIYDLLPIPDYYSNGITDPRLETRFLLRNQNLVYGPDQVARLMEAAGAETRLLTATQNKTSSEWLDLHPSLRVEPNEQLLLRFEFDPQTDYSGYLIGTTADGDYREYILPESGMPKAFGTTAQGSRVLALRNTTERAVEYNWAHLLRPPTTLKGGGQRYANVVISHYKPELNPIQIESFVPYRARVNAPSDGYLETPRILLPGYKAWVDSKRAPIEKSNQKLLMVPVPEGRHDVEVRFVGTARIWTAAVISVIAWLMFFWRFGRGRETQPALTN
ncbi:MAG TPA: hypothetical protein VFT72_20075 [Opitutaceae bacterium]|nr:hypothetical protein [Opitutaceae bacterium]